LKAWSGNLVADENAFGPPGNWLPLATITLTNSPEMYFDVSAIGQPARFYRFVQVP
jgi:hypothetical protein